ncbi:HPr family phosphocarrier protein [Neomegalonema perideroedes]|uniref:HPr family phosphocarrier protein n=1 Tax=Neomegalonema perideroedes TaxID=217219 RepID=UPI00037705F9|nr:HPr family phosphocarrier protein [Neomegalonema perideroedes]
MDGFLERDLVIANAKGLHARAAARVAVLAEGYDARGVLFFENEEADIRSILDLLTLGAAQGAQVRLRVWGAQAMELAEALVALIRAKFGEED